MSAELEYFPKAIPYFRNFVSANLDEFYDHMIEYRTYPNGGYGSFYRDNEVMQHLVDIYHNIDETFGTLQIPEQFASPKKLAQAWKSFLIFLKSKDKLFDDIYSKLGNKQDKLDDFPYPPILVAIDIDRRKVIDLLEHILTFDEVKHFLTDHQLSETQADEIKSTKAPSRAFDIVIITAIHKEYEQVTKLIQNGSVPNFKDPSRTIYYQGIIVCKNGKSLKVLVTCANQMGMTSAASLASKAIYRFTPRVVAMCGIAAGIEGQIGDIMIPDMLWDYGSGKNVLEPIKILKLIKKEREKFIPYKYPIVIKQDLIGQVIRLTKDTNINENIFQLGGHINFENKPSKIYSKIGPFVSGSAVIANDNILSKIKNQDGKLVGFDMEAFAIAYACSVSDITPQPIAFIAKSISDYGNKRKGHTDKDKHQEYAAFTSASFVISLFQEYPELFDLF